MRTRGVAVVLGALPVIHGEMVMLAGGPARLGSGIDRHADARDGGGGAPDDDEQGHQDEG